MVVKDETWRGADLRNWFLEWMSSRGTTHSPGRTAVDKWVVQAALAAGVRGEEANRWCLRLKGGEFDTKRMETRVQKKDDTIWRMGGSGPGHQRGNSYKKGDQDVEEWDRSIGAGASRTPPQRVNRLPRRCHLTTVFKRSFGEIPFLVLPV